MGNFSTDMLFFLMFEIMRVDMLDGIQLQFITHNVLNLGVISISL